MTASGLEVAAPGDVGVWRAGWRSFWSRPERVLVPVLAASFVVVLTHVLIQIALGFTITAGRDCTREIAGLRAPSVCAAAKTHAINGLVIGLLAFFFLAQLFWAVVLRAGLSVLSKTAPPPLRTVAGQALGLAAVLAVALTFGAAFGFLPSIVVAFFAQFAMTAVVVDGRGCWAAIGDSLRFARRNLPAVLGFSVVAVLALMLGGALLVVGLWPAVAIIGLAHLHLWRSRTAAPV